MAYKGKFKPKHRDKYKGNPTNIIYRSLWERRFMVYCDSNDSVVKWSSEEIVIPYRSPFDRKIHKYYPDFWVKIKKHDGTIETSIIEVKPKAQVRARKASIPWWLNGSLVRNLAYRRCRVCS